MYQSLHSVSLTTLSRMNCNALTLCGDPCKRKARKGEQFCFQHVNFFDCSICMETKSPVMEQKLSTCIHTFCKKCFDKWKAMNNHTCPCCRTPFINNRKKINNKIIELLHILHSARGVPQQKRIYILDDVFNMFQLSEAKTMIENEILRSVIKTKLDTFENQGVDMHYIRKWRKIANL